MNGPRQYMMRLLVQSTDFILINKLKAMKTIPMKVETKMMAFTDTITTLNDKVIAFRATVLKNGRGGDCSFHCNPGIFIINYFVDPISNF